MSMPRDAARDSLKLMSRRRGRACCRSCCRGCSRLSPATRVCAQPDRRSSLSVTHPRWAVRHGKPRRSRPHVAPLICDLFVWAECVESVALSFGSPHTILNSQYNRQYTIHTLCTLCLFSYSLRFRYSTIRSPVNKVQNKQVAGWLCNTAGAACNLLSLK